MRLHGMEANGGADWIILTKGTEAVLQMLALKSTECSDFIMSDK